MCNAKKKKPNQKPPSCKPCFLHMELILHLIVIDWKTIYNKLRLNCQFCNFYLAFRLCNKQGRSTSLEFRKSKKSN